MADLLLARIRRLAQVGGVRERIGNRQSPGVEDVLPGFEVPPGVVAGHLGGKHADQAERRQREDNVGESRPVPDARVARLASAERLMWVEGCGYGATLYQ